MQNMQNTQDVQIEQNINTDIENNNENDTAVDMQQEPEKQKRPSKSSKKMQDLELSPEAQQEKVQTLKRLVIHALEDIKAKEILYIDVSKKTKLFDGVVICCAGSYVQARALAHHLIDELKKAGFETRLPEGLEGAEWVLVDCVDIVVHIMLPPIRAYYRLEEIWQ